MQGQIKGATSNAEQSLKQARELLDKKLINEQQYNDFVAKIMKDMCARALEVSGAWSNFQRPMAHRRE